MYNNADEVRGIIADFKKLATKIQQDSEAVKNTFRDRETILSACQKEYEKLYYAHEAPKKKYNELEQKL